MTPSRRKTAQAVPARGSGPSPVIRQARRRALGGLACAGAGRWCAALVPGMAGMAGSALAGTSGPSEAAPSLEAAILAFTRGAVVVPGKVRLEIAPLVDNGNTVPLSVSVDAPMRPDAYVSAIAVFSERNPQHEVAVFELGPLSGSARVSTRIRLATSQKLVAIARLSDGSLWSGQAEAIVTLAACLEE